MVLLVDDRPDNLLALRAVLEPLGLDLVEAASGEEALRHLLAGEFALIVLDVQMPVLDGFETARLIRGRERTRYVPIIFLTAISGEPEHYLRGYESGAVDYVYKPFEPEILRAKVSVFAELWTRGATIEAQREELAGRLAELDEAHAGLAAQAVELERSNAALERFAEVVGVELREPLHTVAGLLDLLDDRHAGAAVGRGAHPARPGSGRHGPGPVDRRLAARLRPGLDRRPPAGPVPAGRGPGRGGGRDRPPAVRGQGRGRRRRAAGGVGRPGAARGAAGPTARQRGPVPGLRRRRS